MKAFYTSFYLLYFMHAVYSRQTGGLFSTISCQFVFYFPCIAQYRPHIGCWPVQQMLAGLLKIVW